MNYLFKILYACFVFIPTNVLYNVALEERKIILGYKFIRLNVKIPVVGSSNLFVLWKRIFKYIFVCHFNTSIMLMTKNVNVIVINISDVIILIVDILFVVFLLLIYIGYFLLLWFLHTRLYVLRHFSLDYV